MITPLDERLTKELDDALQGSGPPGAASVLE